METWCRFASVRSQSYTSGVKWTLVCRSGMCSLRCSVLSMHYILLEKVSVPPLDRVFALRRGGLWLLCVWFAQHGLVREPVGPVMRDPVRCHGCRNRCPPAKFRVVVIADLLAVNRREAGHEDQRVARIVRVFILPVREAHDFIR